MDSLEVRLDKTIMVLFKIQLLSGVSIFTVAGLVWFFRHW